MSLIIYKFRDDLNKHAEMEKCRYNFFLLLLSLLCANRNERSTGFPENGSFACFRIKMCTTFYNTDCARFEEYNDDSVFLLIMSAYIIIPAHPDIIIFYSSSAHRHDIRDG